LQRAQARPSGETCPVAMRIVGFKLFPSTNMTALLLLLSATHALAASISHRLLTTACDSAMATLESSNATSADLSSAFGVMCADTQCRSTAAISLGTPGHGVTADDVVTCYCDAVVTDGVDPNLINNDTALASTASCAAVVVARRAYYCDSAIATLNSSDATSADLSSAFGIMCADTQCRSTVTTFFSDLPHGVTADELVTCFCDAVVTDGADPHLIVHGVDNALASTASCSAVIAARQPSPPTSPPPPRIPPLSPFAPLTAGEAIVEEEAHIVTVEVTLAGDISSVDKALLTAAMATELGCVSPCQLDLSLSSGSVTVTAKMTIPTAEASTAASVASNAATFAATSPSALTTSLASAGVTVSAVNPTVAQVTQTVAIKVAPPPPSPPPMPPPSPSLPPPSSPPPTSPPPSSPSGGGSSDNSGAVVGGVLGGISAPLFAAIGYYAYRKKKPRQVKVTS